MNLLTLLRHQTDTENSKKNSPTSGVILADSNDLELLRGVSIAKLSRYLADYHARHPG